MLGFQNLRIVQTLVSTERPVKQTNLILSIGYAILFDTHSFNKSSSTHCICLCESMIFQVHLHPDVLDAPGVPDYDIS